VWPWKRAPRRPPHHLSPSPPRLGWPHLCPARFVQPASTVLSYLCFDLSSSTIHARPLLLSLCLTKPDHVLPRHLCLQALRSPKPRRPMPQVRAPSKPAFRPRARHVRLAGGTPRRYRVVWTPSLFIDSYLLYLVWPVVFALRFLCFRFPFRFRLTALHSSPSSFILAIPPDRLLCPLSPWLSRARCYMPNYNLFRNFFLSAHIAAVILAAQVLLLAGSTSHFLGFHLVTPLYRTQ
jgi:hypothetical protein